MLDQILDPRAVGLGGGEKRLHRLRATGSRLRATMTT
jgi:hypothetical protein